MRLVLLHPEVATRSCADCVKYVYDDRPEGFGKRVARRGLPVLRPKGAPTPCSWCPKQPADVPDWERTPGTAQDLSERNWQAYRHYLECKAVGHFPDDPIVRRNAMVIAAAEKVEERIAQLNAAALSGRLSSFGGL